MEAEEPRAPAAVIRRGELRSFVESVVAPYRVAAENPELPRLRELADAEAGVRMRAILHHSAFQALESAWRAVFHLVRATETGSQLQIYLVDVSKAELAADLSAADDLRKSRAWRMLVEETGGDGWSVVAGNYAFAQTVNDAEMLGRLAKIMSYAGAPFLAEADPGRRNGCGRGNAALGAAPAIAGSQLDRPGDAPIAAATAVRKEDGRRGELRL